MNYVGLPIILTPVYQITPRSPGTQVIETADGKLLVLTGDPSYSATRNWASYGTRFDNFFGSTKLGVNLFDPDTGLMSAINANYVDALAVVNNTYLSEVALNPPYVATVGGCINLLQNLQGNAPSQQTMNVNCGYADGANSVVLPQKSTEINSTYYPFRLYTPQSGGYFRRSLRVMGLGGPSTIAAQIWYTKNNPLYPQFDGWMYGQWLPCPSSAPIVFGTDGRITMASYYVVESQYANLFQGFRAFTSTISHAIWCDDVSTFVDKPPVPVVFRGVKNVTINDSTMYFPGFNGSYYRAVYGQAKICPLAYDSGGTGDGSYSNWRNAWYNQFDFDWCMNDPAYTKYNASASGNTPAYAPRVTPVLGRNCLLIANIDTHNGVAINADTWAYMKTIPRAYGPGNAVIINGFNLTLIWNVSMYGYNALSSIPFLNNRADFYAGKHYIFTYPILAGTQRTNGNPVPYSLQPSPQAIGGVFSSCIPRMCVDGNIYMITVQGKTPDQLSSFTSTITDVFGPTAPSQSWYQTMMSQCPSWCNIDFLHIRPEDGLIGAICVDKANRSWYCIAGLPTIQSSTGTTNMTRSVLSGT